MKFKFLGYLIMGVQHFLFAVGRKGVIFLQDNYNLRFTAMAKWG